MASKTIPFTEINFLCFKHTVKPFASKPQTRDGYKLYEIPMLSITILQKRHITSENALFGKRTFWLKHFFFVKSVFPFFSSWNFW